MFTRPRGMPLLLSATTTVLSAAAVLAPAGSRCRRRGGSPSRSVPPERHRQGR